MSVSSIQHSNNVISATENGAGSPENLDRAESIKDAIEFALRESIELKAIEPFMSDKQKEIKNKMAGVEDNSIRAPQNQDTGTNRNTTQAIAASQDNITSVIAAASANIRLSSSQFSMNSSQDNGVVTTSNNQSELSISSEAPQRSDPLAIDLDGNGFATTGINKPVEFDINADGRTDKMSNLNSGDAFLALDKNKNNRIDDGKELFGDQLGAQNGFEELAKYDDNQDGVINKQDDIYSELKLMQLSEQGQKIQDLAQAGIQSILLAYRTPNNPLAQGDILAQSGLAIKDNGQYAAVGDLLLTYYND